ncbi:conserved Plasmodium protein, unknown function [Plasmodium relictum]|uniref:Mediator of RNA polymerase II transcription subunit 4 n=1 Tax=Plasmodium relictum TaxID=85471 RepID=A0A1J1H8H2_PLARL|nr:conserved Plasmodium protein, unknown function [Plasmodium relictum]CRH01272.1 conserved Plasmodium protein, unknown function [Plasmodium relictum]
MECDYENEKSFHKIVLTIKNKIEKYDINKWKNIVKPEDVSYNAYFEKLVKEDIEYNDKENKINEENVNNENEKKENTYEINKDFFDNISNREKFYFLLNIKETMETSWLLAHKRLEGIRLEENSELVNVQELINYSKKLSDTTCAPPECDNINDKIIHQEYYPNYHFLNFVNIEEIHLSKLFQLQKYSAVCFPPIITIQENDNLLIVNITCSTPNTTIYYKVNEELKENIYDSYNKPKISKRQKINIYAWSVKEGYIKSRISCFSKTYNVNDPSQNLLNNENSLFFPDSIKSDKGENENILNKHPSSTNVFKNLGFLLSRKKEKKSETSSNEESSLSDEEK